MSFAENCLMQRAARAGNEAAALFLATHGAKVNHVNKWVSAGSHMFLCKNDSLNTSKELNFALSPLHPSGTQALICTTGKTVLLFRPLYEHIFAV